MKQHSNMVKDPPRLVKVMRPVNDKVGALVRDSRGRVYVLVNKSGTVRRVV